MYICIPTIIPGVTGFLRLTEDSSGGIPSNTTIIIIIIIKEV